jgi:hypothetical protein
MEVSSMKSLIVVLIISIGVIYTNGKKRQS